MSNNVEIAGSSKSAPRDRNSYAIAFSRRNSGLTPRVDSRQGQRLTHRRANLHVSTSQIGISAQGSLVETGHFTRLFIIDSAVLNRLFNRFLQLLNQLAIIELNIP